MLCIPGGKHCRIYYGSAQFSSGETFINIVNSFMLGTLKKFPAFNGFRSWVNDKLSCLLPLSRVLRPEENLCLCFAILFCNKPLDLSQCKRVDWKYKMEILYFYTLILGIYLESLVLLISAREFVFGSDCS